MGVFLSDSIECEIYNRLLSNTKLLATIRNELCLTLAEFAEIFMPKARFVLAGLVQILTKKVPRPYTISSFYSTQACCWNWLLKSTRADLLNHGLNPETFHKRRFYKGACSDYLCNAKPGQVIKLFKRQSVFSTLDVAIAPMIMIANGTGNETLNFSIIGIAPFRAFWQDPNLNNGNVLFFGCRSPSHELYSVELRALQDQGRIQVHVCYSRDGVSDEAPLTTLLATNLRPRSRT
ncbi:bifunctional Ferredoxin-NADP reductase (FNR) [Babesia duncani]|uniref:NADPH--hemoprotein reductase n=1 Tax=Babesia duncani TaxID=323732 RepID=A0AAD9UQ14_9APIC|nr:bifunctional Ferredoxin-NADP reductase (FNR) [Babesia duncani]